MKAFLVVALTGALVGAVPVEVSLNQKPLVATVVVRSGRVLLPFRAIFGALKATVKYDARTHVVIAQRGGERIVLKVGTHQSIVLAQHLYVPARYVAQSFGARVDYDAVDRIVFITDPALDTRVVQNPPVAPVQPPPNDVPATPPPFYTAPIPYATDNGYGSSVQSMNFYVPSNQYRYFPGQRLEFVLSAPPGGAAYAELCGLGRLPFINPPGSSQYFLGFIVPRRLSGHACSVRAEYAGALGARRSILLANTVEFPAVTPSPSPTPTPSPAPKRVPQPVGRSPQDRGPAPTPQGKPAQ